MSNLEKSKMTLFVLTCLSSNILNIKRTQYVKGEKSFIALGANFVRKY